MAEAPDIAAPGAPTTCVCGAEDWTRPFALRQLQRLDDLAEAGLQVARGVERRANDPAADDDPTRLAMGYARAARAVRLTVMLQAKLIKDIKADAQALARADAEARAEAVRQAAEEAAVSDPAYRMKARVEAIVERVARARHPGDKPLVDRLLRESAERLDDEDLYGDLLERPLSELVARLCQDLGLEPDWAALAEEFWALREVESGEVGWPLAELPNTRPPLRAGEAAQRAAGGIPPPLEEACEHATSRSSAPDD